MTILAHDVVDEPVPTLPGIHAAAVLKGCRKGKENRVASAGSIQSVLARRACTIQRLSCSFFPSIIQLTTCPSKPPQPSLSAVCGIVYIRLACEVNLPTRDYAIVPQLASLYNTIATLLSRGTRARL